MPDLTIFDIWGCWNNSGVFRVQNNERGWWGDMKSSQNDQGNEGNNQGYICQYRGTYRSTFILIKVGWSLSHLQISACASQHMKTHHKCQKSVDVEWRGYLAEILIE